jgi:hypothetical protein
MTVRVVLEVAAKRSFASALDWPGWSRSGRSPDEALGRLVEYGPRYAAIAKRAKVAFAVPSSVDELEVVERVRGGSGTEFGVPGASAKAEAERIPPRELDRLISLLQTGWKSFDRAAKAAEGTHLRLGPRGGGRQVPKMVEHVREAEGAYLHQLGWKTDRSAGMAELRKAFVEALRLRAAGQELPTPNKVRSPWEPAYAIRRSAWHAVDHAWEIEDRSARP